VVENQLRVTPPTGFSQNAQNLAALAPPLPANPIVQFNEPGDAGQLYRQAAIGFADNSELCEQFERSPVGAPPPPIQLVLDATNKRGVDIFADIPGVLVNYSGATPGLDVLNDLGHLIDGAGLMLVKEKQVEDARRFYRAVYSMGLRLYDERLDYEEYARGMGLMNEATIGLAECEPQDSPLRADLQRQEEAIAAYDENHVRPIYQVLVSADQQAIADNAGDIFAFATQSGERMFRVEAILKLGRYRFDAARNADQVAVPRYLRKLLEDPDPVIRMAASAAQGLTLEQYRMIH
jgi:hypothetical protein